MICPKCGKESLPNFCVHCGAKLTESAPAAPNPAKPPAQTPPAFGFSMPGGSAGFFTPEKPTPAPAPKPPVNRSNPTVAANDPAPEKPPVTPAQPFRNPFSQNQPPKFPAQTPSAPSPAPTPPVNRSDPAPAANDPVPEKPPVTQAQQFRNPFSQNQPPNFSAPELTGGFFIEQPAGTGSSRFSLPPAMDGGGFTISLQREDVTAITPEQPVPPQRNAPDDNLTSFADDWQPERADQPQPNIPPKHKPVTPPSAPDADAGRQEPAIPEGFFLVPEPEKTAWGNFKRFFYKLLDYKGLVPALIVLIFVLGFGAGYFIFRSGTSVQEESSTAESSSEAEESSVPVKPAEPDPMLDQYLSLMLLPESPFLPLGETVTAGDANGIISAVNDGEQLTVFRIQNGDLQIDTYASSDGTVSRVRGTTCREFLKQVYDASGTVTVTADGSGVYLDGKQIWKHGLRENAAQVTVFTCMKQTDAEHWDRASYLFTDSTNIRTAMPS